MTTNQSGLSPYIDSGTGAVAGPPPEVTTEALEHLGEPTGASPNPPTSVTSYADETYRPKTEEAPVEAKAMEPAQVDTKVVTEAENKAVVQPAVKTPAKRPVRKRGA